MTTPTPRRPDDLVAALADAFDTVAPNERAAAEQELLAAGLDPAAIAARFAAIAAPATRRTDAGPLRRAAATRTTASRRGWWVAIAAALAAAIALTLRAAHPPLQSVARTAPAPRTIELPPAHAAAPKVGAANGAQRAVGGEPHTTTISKSITPVVVAPESADETQAIARIAAELGASLQAAEPLPPMVAASLRAGTLAQRKVTLAPDTIAGLLSAAFTAASEANEGRYEVDPKTCRLLALSSSAPVSQRFGYPFPVVSPDSRRAGCEIMWNVEAAFAAGGGHRGRASACDVNAGPQCTDFGFKSLSFVGRQSGPIDNPFDLRGAKLAIDEGTSLSTRGQFILQVYSLDGSDAQRWFFIPEFRRVRRLGRDSLVDSLPPFFELAAGTRSCADPSPEAFRWALIGQQEVLAPLSGQGIPLGETVGDDGVTPPAEETLTLTRRPVWVVAAVERGRPDVRERLVLYIDQELYRPYWRVEYNGHAIQAASACAAAWGRDGDVVAPLTSAQIRFDGEGRPIQRFTPYDETLDQTLRGDQFTIKDALP